MLVYFSLILPFQLQLLLTEGRLLQMTEAKLECL